MWPLITHALEFGLILSAVLIALLLVVLRANPEIISTTIRPTSKRSAVPIRESTKRQRGFVAAIFAVVIVGVAAWSLNGVRVLAARDVTFGVAFAHFAIMFGTFNVLDCFVLDWGLVYWQPRFAVLPGTEGHGRLRSYWFHFRGFLIGIPIVLSGSAIMAAFVSILY